MTRAIPADATECARILADAARDGRTVRIIGSGSKSYVGDAATTARIDRLKDTETFLRVAARVRETHPSARFTIYGAVSDATYYDECLALRRDRRKAVLQPVVAALVAPTRRGVLLAQDSDHRRGAGVVGREVRPLAVRDGKLAQLRVEGGASRDLLLGEPNRLLRGLRRLLRGRPVGLRTERIGALRKFGA